MVVQGGEARLLMPPSWLEVPKAGLAWNEQTFNNMSIHKDIIYIFEKLF